METPFSHCLEWVDHYKWLQALQSLAAFERHPEVEVVPAILRLPGEASHVLPATVGVRLPEEGAAALGIVKAWLGTGAWWA
ncbi:hypothetical protein D3C86_1984280 [compost metagenome]